MTSALPTGGHHHAVSAAATRPPPLAALVGVPVPVPLRRGRWPADPLHRRGVRPGAAVRQRRAVVLHVPRRDRAPTRPVPLPDARLSRQRALAGGPRPRPQRPGQRRTAEGVHRLPRPAGHHAGGARRRRAGRFPGRRRATGADPGPRDHQYVRLAAGRLPGGPADAQARQRAAVRRAQQPHQRHGAVHGDVLRGGPPHERGRPPELPRPLALPGQPPGDARGPGRSAADRPDHGRGRAVPAHRPVRPAGAHAVRAQERSVRLAGQVRPDLPVRDRRRHNRRAPLPVQRRPAGLRRRDLHLVGPEGRDGTPAIHPAKS